MDLTGSPLEPSYSFPSPRERAPACRAGRAGIPGFQHAPGQIVAILRRGSHVHGSGPFSKSHSRGERCRAREGLSGLPERRGRPIGRPLRPRGVPAPGLSRRLLRPRVQRAARRRRVSPPGSGGRSRRGAARAGRGAGVQHRQGPRETTTLPPRESSRRPTIGPPKSAPSSGRRDEDGCRVPPIPDHRSAPATFLALQEPAWGSPEG